MMKTTKKSAARASVLLSDPATRSLQIHGRALVLSTCLALLSAFGCKSGTAGTSESGLGGAENLGGAGSDFGEQLSGGTGGRKTEGEGAGGSPSACEEDDTCTCPTGQFLSEGECIESACAEGRGVFPETAQCFVCSPALSCGGSGETGRLLATVPADGGSCICETKSGYFPGSEGSIAEKCDADGDGWVSDRAQPAVESKNAVVRENARCDVRRVRGFFLENEAGQIYDVAAEDEEADLTARFSGGEGVPAGLPLYESSRNDADVEGTLPYYGEPPLGRPLKPEEVNSLTKACIGTTTDANENGISDVSEWSGAESGRNFANQALKSYYETYTEYGYFLALHEGRWEPDAQAGIYRIVEQGRSPAGESSAARAVPIEYPVGTPDYARKCARHPDTQFLSGAGEVSAASTTGADFIRFADAEMLHHSQFKCVQVTTKAGYAGATAEARPELVYLDEAGKVTRQEGASLVSSKWTLNDCFAESTATLGANNPALPEIICHAREAAPPADTVYFAAVHYAHYQEPYFSRTQPGGYVRGCANECADSGAAPNDCWGCSEESFGEAVTRPYGTPCGADAESCDGNGVCSGCVPGHTQCKNASVQQVCSEERSWEDNVSCQFGCHPAEGTCYPACVPETKGCSPGGVPRVCDDNGSWEALAGCVGQAVCTAGECLIPDGKACSSGPQCQSGVCSAFFDDQDSDGFGAGQVHYCGTSPPAKAATVSGDCCDQDDQAKPGQLSYFPTPNACGDYDYNCDDAEQKRYTRLSVCYCGAPSSWLFVPEIPACGVQAKYGGCANYQGACGPDHTAPFRTQECR